MSAATEASCDACIRLGERLYRCREHRPPMVMLQPGHPSYDPNDPRAECGCEIGLTCNDHATIDARYVEAFRAGESATKAAIVAACKAMLAGELGGDFDDWNEGYQDALLTIVEDHCGGSRDDLPLVMTMRIKRPSCPNALDIGNGERTCPWTRSSAG